WPTGASKKCCERKAWASCLGLKSNSVDATVITIFGEANRCTGNRYRQSVLGIGTNDRYWGSHAGVIDGAAGHLAAAVILIEVFEVPRWRNDDPQDRTITQAAETRRTVDSRRGELPGAGFPERRMRSRVYRARPGFAYLGCRRQRVCGLHRLVGSAHPRACRPQ